MIKGTKVNIFDYLNFREFLKDAYAAQKKSNKKFSFRYFSQKAGFLSPNYLHMVMNGIRNLTKDCLPKFAKALELNKRELRYFEALVSFNQAKEPEAKSYYLGVLNALRKDKVGKPLHDHQMELLSKWFYPVMMELVSLPHFEEDPNWIRKQFGGKVSTKEAREALDSMFKIGLLVRDESGRLRRTDAHLTTEEEVRNTAAYTFHHQMLSLARDTIFKVRGDKREISGVTMAVSEKQFMEVKRMVQDFENTVLSYLSDNPDVPGNVFQLNVQLFPVTGEGSGGMNVQ